MTKRQKALKTLSAAWAENWSSWLVFTLSLALLACLFISILPGKAKADPGLQTMVYDVYASGFHVVQAKLDIDLRKKDRYDLVLSAHTRGFLGTLAPWEGTFESHGWILEDGSYRPQLHKSTTVWEDEPDVKEYTYGRDGSFKSLVYTDMERTNEKQDVDDELTQGTTDALTAALEVLQNVAKGSDCEGSSEVFDGKRRFEQVFNHKDRTDIIPTRYNIYNGPAVRCTVEVVPVAGNWHKKPRGWMSIQEQGRARGTMPTVWIAPIEEKGPAVPVKILVRTKYGALVMHLAEYHNAEGIQISQMREE